MYKRILLKLSGEALAGAQGHGICEDTVDDIVGQLIEVHKLGVEIAIVVGGGNFWRGKQRVKMERTTADHMGMLATIMNSLALQDAIEKRGVGCRVQTGLAIPSVAEPFILRKAQKHLETKKRIVIFACGTGNPYFSTDTGAALRAAEIGANALLMAKNIDGLYDSDPRKNKNAKKYEKISYLDVVNKGLQLMDTTSITLCMENKIPIITFGLDTKDSILRVVRGEKIGTVVSD
ncbi:MAG: UMP kinase [Firmicutes bacterium]|nr:UMP kinase [Bacillota bacterium]